MVDVIDRQEELVCVLIVAAAELGLPVGEDAQHRGGPRFSDRLLRWSPDPTGGIWNATKETELPG